MHGNERLPALALASAGIPQIIANPRAVAENKRYCDQDMNAAFGKAVTDYESKRAQELLGLISPDTTIIDFHSYEADAGPFVILVDPNMLPLALRTGIPRIVYMKHSVKKGSALINYRKGISVEVGNHFDPRGFGIAISVAQNLLNNVVQYTMPNTELFEVYGEITEPGEYENFVEAQAVGESFYPIFAKKNTYGNYGLKARRVEAFTD